MSSKRLVECFVTLSVVTLVTITGCPYPLSFGVVLSTSPADGTSNVPLNAAISVSFDRAAIPDTLDGAIEPAVTYTVAWSQGNTVVTVTPTAPLAANTRYTATITACQFADGALLSGPVTFSFTTAADGGTGGGAVPGTGTGATYYVAANAAGTSDSNDGLAQTHEGGTRGPWLTIGHAVATMQAGDTTQILAGSYAEAIRFTRSGAANEPITLSGTGADQVIIDGGGTEDATVLLDPEVGYVTVEGLTVQNCGAVGIGAGPAPAEPEQPEDTRRSNNIVIRNVHVDGYSWAGILLHNADQFTLDGVLTDHGGSVGVLLENCAHGTVENSTFRNNPTLPPHYAHGLETQRGHHITIRNCTAYNNQNFGFDISVYPHVPPEGDCDYPLDEALAWVCHDIVVEECLAYDNGNAGFVVNNGSYDVVFRRNVSWSNGSGWGGFLTY
jgi:hypothetical protein